MKPAMEKEWDDIVERFGYPSLSFPSFVEDEETTAFIDLKQNEITVGTNFLKDLGMGVKGFKAVAGHEVGHHVVFPYDMKRCMNVVNEMETYVSDPERAENLFGDIIVNIDLVENRGIDDIARVYQQFDDESRRGRAVKGVLSYKTSVDFGIGDIEAWDEKTAEMTKELCDLHYRATGDEAVFKNARSFARILDKYDDESESSPSCIDEVFEDNVELGNLEWSVRRDAAQLDVSVLSSMSKDVLREYYRSKSRPFQVSFDRESEGSISGEGYDIFEQGDRIADVDIFKSYGKVLPGVSKKQRSNDMVDGSEAGRGCYADAVVCLDSSGSMTDPAREDSAAVIGGFAVVKSYLMGGKEAACVNFSDVTSVTGFTADQEALFDELLCYHGGGTRFDAATVESVMEGRRAVDLYVISDMDLENGSRFDAFVDARAEDCSVTVFDLGYDRFEKEGVQVYDIRSEEDIPELVQSELEGVL